MNFITGNKGTGQQGFTLIELLVVIAILAVLAAVAIPAYSRFFGAGTDEANAAEKSNIQAAMDAMMANWRIITVDENNTWVDAFDNQPTIGTGTLATTYVDGVPTNGTYENLFPYFLRIGEAGSTPTKMCYRWNNTGFIEQIEHDPDTGRCPV